VAQEIGAEMWLAQAHYHCGVWLQDMRAAESRQAPDHLRQAAAIAKRCSLLPLLEQALSRQARQQ
jgi:hypothetical protein